MSRMCTLEAQENEVLWRTNLKKCKVFQPDPPRDFYCFIIKINFKFTRNIFNDLFRHDSCHHKFIVLYLLTLSLDFT